MNKCFNFFLFKINEIIVEITEIEIEQIQITKEILIEKAYKIIGIMPTTEKNKVEKKYFSLLKITNAAKFIRVNKEIILGKILNVIVGMQFNKYPIK